MFRPLRSNEKTSGQLLRAELSQSMDHAKRAAGYAAGGVKAAIGPKVSPAAKRVRGTAARLKNARTEEKVASRWPKLAGLLGVGALVGAVTAFVLRRRRQQQWEDYDPMEAVSKEREEGSATPSAGEKAEPSEEQSRT